MDCAADLPGVTAGGVWGGLEELFVEGGADVLRMDELLVVELDAGVGVGVGSLAGESSDSLPECGGVGLVREGAEEGSPGLTTVVVDDLGDLDVEGGEIGGSGVL